MEDLGSRTHKHLRMKSRIKRKEKKRVRRRFQKLKGGLEAFEGVDAEEAMVGRAWGSLSFLQLARNRDIKEMPSPRA